LQLKTLAAKAAGFEYDNPDFMRGLLSTWNPLEDDGDALRLAVKLGIDIETHGSLCTFQFVCASVKIGNDIIQFEEESTLYSDVYAVTRLAITKAAAAVGCE
jgi:hypothetical protein